jgi:hypothetical protein
MNVVDMPDKNDMRAAIELIKRHRKDLIEMISIGSALKYHAFTKYKEAGFTEQQALELCKASVLTP